MDYIRGLVALFILLLSQPLYADTYPASDANRIALCSAHTIPTNYPDCSAFYVNAAQTSCVSTRALNGALCQAYSLGALNCPYGGTLSGTLCINAPACPTGQTRDSKGECKPPDLNCPIGQVDGGFGECVTKECTWTAGGTTLNKTTGACQTPPQCAANENYDNATNTCKLKKLNCPTHSHANATNDACLADPPLDCPAGQHDDGSYKCIADDPQACTSDQSKGYIYGVPVCVPKHNTAQKKKDVENQQKARDTAQTNSEAARSRARDLRNQADADPTNTQKQTAADDADTAATAADDALAKSERELEKQQAESDTAALNQIADNTKGTNNLITDIFKGDGTQPIPDVLATQTINPNLGTEPGFDQSGSCPGGISAGVSSGELFFSVDPFCELAESIRFLVIALGFLAAGYIVFSPIRG